MTKTDLFLSLERLVYCCSPSHLIDQLDFNEGLRAADAILHNDDDDWHLRLYASVMLENLRVKHPEAWNSSWRYDAYLGYAHCMTCEDEQKYAAYSRALMKINPLPPQLLVEIAGCCIAPGEAPITKTEAILLLKQLIRENTYIEAVSFLVGLCYAREESEAAEYWEHVLEKKQNNISAALPRLYDLPETKEKWIPSPNLMRAVDIVGENNDNSK